VLVLFKDGDDDDHKELEVLRKDKSTEEDDDDVTNKRSFFSLLASCQICKQRKLFDNRRFDVNSFYEINFSCLPIKMVKFRQKYGRRCNSQALS